MMGVACRIAAAGGAVDALQLRRRDDRDGDRLRGGHRRIHAATVDHLAAALARVVAGVLHQRRAHLRHAAIVAVSLYFRGPHLHLRDWRWASLLLFGLGAAE